MTTGHRRGRPPYLAGATVAATATMVIALLLTGGAPGSVPTGLPDAGAVTGWGLPSARLFLDLTAIATIGALLAGAVLAATGAQRPAAVALRAVRAGSWWATGWVLATALTLVLTLSDVTGLPVSAVIASDLVPRYTWALPQTRALLISLLLAAAVAVSGRRVMTTGGARSVLAVALLGTTPTLFTGHAASAAEHQAATTSLVVHVLAATVWIGGLFGLTVYLRGSGEVLTRAVTRFSVIALACFCIVAGSGLLAAVARLGTSPGAWTSAYGVLLVVKSAALVALGVFGWRHRARTLPLLASGQAGAFLRLAAGEVTIMVATVGLAVALSRTAAPLAPVVGAEIAPLSWSSLLLEWRPDALTGTIVLVAVALYLRAVVSVTAGGHRWPRRHTAAFVAAAAVALVALSGGVAAYSSVLVSALVGQYLLLAVVVPILVTLGAPTLLHRLRSGRETVPPPPWRLALSDPANALMLWIATAVAVFGTPLLELSLRHALVQLLVHTAAVGSGLVLFAAVLTVGAAPGRRSARDGTGVCVAAMIFLGAFGAVLLTRDALFAGSWFEALELEWVLPGTDQRRAGALVIGFVLLAGPALVLAMRSASRHDATAPAIRSS